MNELFIGDMEITLDNVTMNVTARRMEDGTYLKLTSDYGEWEYRASDRMLATDTDEDRVNYDLWQERYREWNDVTRHEAVEMMDYITKKYAL